MNVDPKTAAFILEMVASAASAVAKVIIKYYFDLDI